jgi:hypothetical protein
MLLPQLARLDAGISALCDIDAARLDVIGRHRGGMRTTRAPSPRPPRERACPSSSAS